MESSLDLSRAEILRSHIYAIRNSGFVDGGIMGWGLVPQTQGAPLSAVK